MWIILSFLNGLQHGLGSDHLLAITNLVHRGGDRRQVSLMGFRFGLGHMGILVLWGTGALIWNLTVSPQWESRAEILGGGVLILLGLWTFVEWFGQVGYLHSHSHSHGSGRRVHSHLHFHFKGRHRREHSHPHGSSLLGALFALSGLRSLLLGIFPVLQGNSATWAMLYILVFGLGIVSSMTAYGLVAKAVVGRPRSRGWVTCSLGLSSITAGIYWIWTSL